MSSKRLLVGTIAAITLVISWALWRNSQVEERRRAMHSIRQGMSQAEIEARLSKPDFISQCKTASTNSDFCQQLHYESPAMTVTLENGVAVTAFFYEGKSETVIFE